MSKEMTLVLVIAVITAVTVLTRALPFIAFGKKELPATVKYLGNVLPAAIMVILVCYCLKGIRFAESPHGLPELLACAAVAGVHLWKKNMYLSIIVGTVCYMVLLRVIV